jgi:hypothetical protein
MSDPQSNISDPNHLAKELADAADTAKSSSEVAQANIRRFLELQAGRNANLIMRAHEQELADAAKTARLGAELAAANIQRFLDVQSSRLASLIMRAQAASGTMGPAKPA